MSEYNPSMLKNTHIELWLSYEYTSQAMDNILHNFCVELRFLTRWSHPEN